MLPHLSRRLQDICPIGSDPPATAASADVPAASLSLLRKRLQQNISFTRFVSLPTNNADIEFNCSYLLRQVWTVSLKLMKNFCGTDRLNGFTPALSSHQTFKSLMMPVKCVYTNTERSWCSVKYIITLYNAFDKVNILDCSNVLAMFQIIISQLCFL